MPVDVSLPAAAGPAARSDSRAPGAAGRPAPPRPRPGGLLADVWHVYTRPSAVFAPGRERSRAAGALLLLVFLQVLAASAVLSTGVPDYEIDRQTRREISRVAAEQDASEVTAAVAALEKGAAFRKLTCRVRLLGGAARTALGAGALAATLFVIIAWRGGKPEFPALAEVAVFAAFAEVPRLLATALLTAALHRGWVDTSAAALVSARAVGPAAYLLLRRLDPFEIWYWALVGLGLWKGGHMGGRRAAATATGLALLAALAGGAADLLLLTDLASPG
jgi:hypothetical protein